MATSFVKMPWAGYSDQYAATKNPTPNYSGELNCEGRENTKSALVKTDPTKRWRPPTNYSRVIRTGPLAAPYVNLRVDYKSSAAPNQKRLVTYVGPATPPPGYQLVVPAFPSDLVGRVEQRAFRKLKQQDLNLGVAFAERTATATHLATTAGRIAAAIRALRRWDLEYMARQLRANPQLLRNRLERLRRRKALEKRLHELWLEAQYAWKPLLSDCYGAVKALHEKDMKNDRYIATCTAKDETYTEAFGSGESNVGFDVLKYPWQSRVRTRFRCYVRYDWELANPMLAQMSELGMTNPLQVAWEVVPFSFVADWFSPFGAYLAALDTGLGWNYKGGSISKLTRSERLFTVTGKPSKWLNTVNAIEQNGTSAGPAQRQRLMSLSRIAVTSRPTAQMPSINDSAMLNAGTRLANAISLIRVAISGSRK